MALVALCAHAKAETLNVTQDRVLVSHGKRFHEAHGSSVVRSGDLVKVEKTGKAQLVFSGGCTVELPVGVTRVVDQPCETPLAAGESSVSDINPLYVIGALAVAGGIGGGIAAATSGNGGNNDNGGATALAIAASQKKVSQ